MARHFRCKLIPCTRANQKNLKKENTTMFELFWLETDFDVLVIWFWRDWYCQKLKRVEKSKIYRYILPETLPNLPYQRQAHMHERFAVPTVDRHSIRLNYLQEIVANKKKNRKNQNQVSWIRWIRVSMCKEIFIKIKACAKLINQAAIWLMRSK